LGKIPEYVFLNAKYLAEIFPAYKVVVVTDSPIAFKSLKRRGISGWLCSDPSKSWAELWNSSEHNRDFRNDFWFKTVARFWSLSEYMSAHDYEAIIHVEADVWLSPSFPFPKFLNLGDKLAYPMKSLDEGLASTLYLGGRNSISALIKHTEESFKENGKSTDVSVLGSFWKGHEQLFYRLPSGPSSIFHHNLTGSQSTIESPARNFEKFNGLFDASSLGIYFTGEDPRNSWGFRTLFKDDHYEFDTRDLSISLKNNSLWLIQNENEYEVFSLHIHSKDRRFFNSIEVFERLSQISILDQHHERNEFLGTSTIRIFFTTLIYTIKIQVKRVIK
jgi:hypothetical protein